MAEPRSQPPALLIVAAFSRHRAALDWARERLVKQYGTVALTSPSFLFNQTDYYAPTMGTDLRKEFLVFGQLAAPESLPDVKRHTNDLERELADAAVHPEPRPLNLDPGFLTLGKFCLATTKDQAHRIYLRDGIFAEVTLRFEAGSFHPCPWTYADYRQPEVIAFLNTARDFYRRRREEMR